MSRMLVLCGLVLDCFSSSALYCQQVECRSLILVLGGVTVLPVAYRFADELFVRLTDVPETILPNEPTREAQFANDFGQQESPHDLGPAT